MIKDSDKSVDVSTDTDKSLELLKRQNQRLSILYDISLTAGKSLELSEILDDSLNRIIHFMGADSGVIYIINDETMELVPMAFKNLSDAAVQDLTRNKVKIGECMCGKIAECDEEVVIYDNASADPRFTREAIKNEGMEFYAGLPLKSKGKVIGVLCVITHEPYTPDDELIEILRAATIPLSLAIDNARIFQTEKSRAELKVKHEEFHGIITISPKMKEVLDLVRKVKDLPTSILIYGESGTGKELIAKAIHYNSTRMDAPFITVNCAAIPDSLLESEFFGYVKGSFTDACCDRKGLFESADGGTVFLDEINTMSIGLQAKLLRVLQDGSFKKIGSTNQITVDVRIIAATNQDILAAIKAKTFREDLFYRLNVFKIDLPPLRQRKEDIPVLVKSFMSRYSTRLGRKVGSISPEALEALMHYDWPGNIRELQNSMERAVAVCEDNKLDIQDFPQEISSQEALPYKNNSLRNMEIEHIQKILTLTQGNKKKAAGILGINVSTLWRKLKQ